LYQKLACAALNVNVMVFNTGKYARNRSTPRGLYWQVDVPTDLDDEDYNPTKAQAIRDEYMSARGEDRLIPNVELKLGMCN
jgi:hypothetical protein